MSPYQASIETLRQTFNRGVTRSLMWRKQQLQQLDKMIKEHKGSIHAALQDDLGKCEFEAIVAETSVIETDISYMLKHVKKWMKPQKVSSPLLTWPAKSVIQAEPLGVVCILGAWNYPFNLSVRPLVAAIAAGNCAVLKPSEMATKTSALLAKLLPLYLDQTAILCIEGDGETADQLLQHPFDHVFYTGNGVIGRKVMAAAAKHLTPVTLELGGKSPCLVDKTADLTLTARRIAWSKWFNAGQTCIAPDYVLVERSIADDLVAALKSELVNFYGNNPKHSDSYGRIVSTRHTQRLANLLDDQPIVHGGESDQQERYIAPTLVLNPAPDSALMTEEIFGPILPIIICDTTDEMLQQVIAKDKPLALYIYTKDSQFQQQAVNTVSSGSVCINDGMMFMANHNLPFGGVGPSGMGRYGGKFGFDTFSHNKSVMTRYFAMDVPLRYPPFTQSKANWMKRIRWFE